MKSPQSYKSRNRTPRTKQGKRLHFNKKFYNSAAWITARSAYIHALTERQIKELELSPDPRNISLLNKVPLCEQCYRLFKAEAYDIAETGTELDHIIPVNPKNALDSEGYGKPLDLDNFQLLCSRHHAKKSQRDNRINKKRK